MSQEALADSRLRSIRINLGADERFPVPDSDGYSVYGALLNALDDVDEAVSQHVHDSPLGSLHSSGIVGTFGGSDRPHHKTVLPGKEYDLTLGVIDPADEEIFQALVQAFVLDGGSIELSNGTLSVQSLESENTTHSELLDAADECDDPSLEVTFRTTTCIEEAGSVTTAFPYRWSVFNSLLSKWNRSCPDELELELDRTKVLRSVIEKPDVDTYRTHSVLVNRAKREDGKNRNIFRQGFTGMCTYDFKGATESLENAVTALAMFGEYSGVGSAVARGCGNVNVEVKS